MGSATLKGQGEVHARTAALQPAMATVAAAPVTLTCKDAAVPVKRVRKRSPKKAEPVQYSSGPWAPSGDMFPDLRVQQPLPRDVRPEMTVLERTINLAICMHCPSEKRDDFRRMVNERLQTIDIFLENQAWSWSWPWSWSWKE